MLKSFLFLMASVVIAKPAFAYEVPLLEKSKCQEKIHEDLLEIYKNDRYGYRGGGFIASIQSTGKVYSIIHFMAPGMASEGLDEVVVFNKDCKVLSKTTIWSD